MTYLQIKTISGFEIQTSVENITAMYKNLEEKSYHVIIGSQAFKLSASEYERVEKSFYNVPVTSTTKEDTDDRVQTNVTSTESFRESKKRK